MGPRSPPLFLFLFLLFLLSGGPPALGNEGGAAGSCRCARAGPPPGKVQSLAARLKSWEHCMDFVLFTFPKITICGLPGEQWVEELMSLTPSKRKGATIAEASKGAQGPTPISYTSPPAPTFTGPPAGTPTDEPPQVQPDPHFTTAAPWAPEPSPDKSGRERKTEDPPRTPPIKNHGETPKLRLASYAPFVPEATVETPGLARSPQTAAQGAAEVGPSRFAPQESPAQHARIAVPTLLAITLLLVVIIVFLLCRKKRQPCQSALATPFPPEDLRGEETLALSHHGEETGS